LTLLDCLINSERRRPHGAREARIQRGREKRREGLEDALHHAGFSKEPFTTDRKSILLSEEDARPGGVQKTVHSMVERDRVPGIRSVQKKLKERQPIGSRSRNGSQGNVILFTTE